MPAETGMSSVGELRIGIDLGGTKIELVALGQDGEERARRRIPTPRDDYAGTLRAIAELVAWAESDCGARGTVGIGTPGAISPASGLLKNSNSVWLNGRPLRADLEILLGRQIGLANDANCFALSEAVDGAARGRRTVFGVIIGTGTGAGIVIDRQVLVGPNAIAGEWGHNPLPWPRDDEWPGPPCYCGQRGCLETFVSGPGLSRTYRALANREARAEEVVHQAAAGDEAAVAALQLYEDRLARGLAHVINVLDPDVIVLGGGMSNARRLYETIPRIWSDYVFSDRVDTPLVPPAFGDASGVRGAAWLPPGT